MNDMRVKGQYYGGSSTTVEQVTLKVDSRGRVSIDRELPVHITFDQLSIKPRLGDSARYIYFPDGYTFETSDNDTVDKICQRWGESAPNILYRLESHYRVVFISLLLLVAFGFFFVRYGIPALSLQITQMLPTEVDEVIAREYLASLDEVFFKPSGLDASEQTLISDDFSRLLNETEHPYQLVFRQGGAIGANAFALPNGTIIVTDELVELAKDPHLLQGILLHEIGHVRHRHAMQSLIRQAGIASIVLLVTGDVSTASSLVLLLPGILLQSQYSREFETQADTYALEQMLAQGLDPADFALIMSKLMASNELGSDEDGEGEGGTGSALTVLDYFSTHPPTQQRIDRFLLRAAVQEDD